MKKEDIKKLDDEYIVHTYARSPLYADHAKGVTVVDVDGKEYIDFSSGIGVAALGYCDDEWVAAVTEQAGKLQHISNLYYTEPMVLLAESLCKKTGMNKAFFCNSGAEANECAIKTARKYGNEKNPKKNKVITLIDSFHGRTIQTLTATGQEDMHKHFGPFAQSFDYVKAGDIKELEEKVDENTCAVMFELIQGEGGVNVMDKEFVSAIARVCAEYDALVVVDEVQTGIGRTGKFFAYENYGIEPDIVTFAKGIGGGLPLGGVLFNDKTQSVLQPGDHGTTFGANPVVCAGALKVMEKMTDDFLSGIAEKGDYLLGQLKLIDNVVDADGIGLMMGFNISGKEPSDVASSCLEKGLIVLTAHGKVRLLPPLVISKEELNKGLEIIKKVASE